MTARLLASAAMASLLLVSVPAPAAEYTTILLEKVVNRTPDQTWAKIGPYCAIATWLKVKCVLTAGNGAAVGTNRSPTRRNDVSTAPQLPSNRLARCGTTEVVRR